ncbi:MAG: MinD/ParA family protein [Aquificaceae bacterium]|nr:MinD/ParA family protein [Aquificaceae bacterium]
MMMEAQALHLLKTEGKEKKTGYIAVASGKGGVGKTLITINMGRIISRNGNRVLIVDGDLGLSNIHIMLGITPSKNLYHYFMGEVPIEDVVVPVEENLAFISSGSGVRELVNLPTAQLRNLIYRLQEYAEKSYHWVIFDTPPGIHTDTLALVSSSQLPVVVTTPEPTAIADAYGLIKVLNQEEKLKEFYLMVNKVQNQEEGLKVFEGIRVVCEKFTSAEVKYLGSIRYNPKIIRHIVNQSPFEEGFTKDLTIALSKLPLNVRPYTQGFWERLLSKLRRGG